jgi:predicted Zn-dependent peptidase
MISPLNGRENTMNALLPSVLRCGNRRHPGIREMNGALDGLYGAKLFPIVRKKGESHIYGLFMELLADPYALSREKVCEGGVRFLCETLFDPAAEGGSFRGDFVRMERGKLSELIAAQMNDKRAWAVHRCYEEMCRDEAFSLNEYGSKDEAERIEPEELYRHYLDSLASSRVEIFFIGPGGLPAADLFKEAFGAARRKSVRPLLTAVIPRADREKRVTDRLDVGQCKLSIGLRTGITASDPDFFALMMFNALFGGGVTSKLFVNVREKLSLCYYADSRVEKHKGLMMVRSGVERDKLSAAESEIRTQLEEIRKGNVSEEEYKSAQKAVINTLRSYQDSPAAVEDFALGEAIAGTGRAVGEYIGAIEKVTPERAVAAANLATVDTVYIMTGKEEKTDAL